MGEFLEEPKNKEISLSLLWIKAQAQVHKAEHGKRAYDLWIIQDKKILSSLPRFTFDLALDLAHAVQILPLKS